MRRTGRVGERIAQARQAAGLSKSDLARKLEVSPTAVWNWETNGVTPRPTMMKQIAAALKVTEAYLLTGHSSGHRTARQIIDEAKAQIAALNGVTADQVQISWKIAG